jgi:hypothetical protein
MSDGSLIAPTACAITTGDVFQGQCEEERKREGVPIHAQQLRGPTWIGDKIIRCT